jgi:Zn-dependent protease with chaperone function
VYGQPGQALPPGNAATDPIASVQLAYLRQATQGILNELVAALPPNKQQRVAGIPLVVDDTPGEVNAFAACSDQGKAAMAITDGLLQIQATLSQAEAHDEIFGTRSVDAYIQTLASQLRPNQPIPAPPSGLFPQANDARVIAREHQVFEEQVAFVMGHELGHHHLGHLPCTAVADPLGAGEVARVLSGSVPLFNQPNEIAADIAGVYNVLDAARLRSARGQYGWTEAGGLLTMRFFSGLEQLSPATLLTAFESSHPPPQLRVPIIQQAANTWRSTGGVQFSFPGF